MVRSFAKLMTTLYRSRPPKLVEQNWTDRLTLMKLGLGLKLLGRERLRDLMRVVMINIYDVMNEHFSHAALKSTIALDAVTGTNMGPRSLIRSTAICMLLPGNIWPRLAQLKS
ncbi:MAG: hypothetical protein CM15mP74_35950 [Halieaceae bacterium]|nr:MAG: hypothetical protein CM15mP74_35950 [Halieaceae bacterium]